MEKKRHITLLLLFISLIMLMIPVTPHHHHADGLICMKHDIAADCCSHPHSADHNHCCCNTGCVTTHFVPQTPASDEAYARPDDAGAVTLFIEPLSNLSIQIQLHARRPDYIYLESLHGTFITRATGLRAPPSVLA